MSRRSRHMIFAVLLIGALAAVSPDGAVAATAACTSIGNMATIDYQVGGVPQTQLSTGASATFTVGNKVDLTVTRQDGSIVTVVTGASGTGAPLTFWVTNAGNATQRYTLSALNYGPTETNPFGGGAPDAFDATVGYDIHVDTGGGYGGNTTTIPSLATGATATVQIRANTIPLAQPNGDIAVVALKAQTINTDNSIVSVSTGTGTVFNAGGGVVCAGIDIVLADIDSDAGQANDAQYDGAYLAKDAYQVQAVVLTVLKSSATITDPVFGTAKVPGAVIEYAVRVTRTGGAGSATGIVITDTVPATTAPVADQYGGTGEVQRVTFNATGSVTTTTDLAFGVDADLSSWNTAAGSTITAACGAFVLDEAGDYCEIKFRVAIQ
ncbi:MAG: hypothetical protein AABZ15_07020 [Nitrospirota bacterium]